MVAVITVNVGVLRVSYVGLNNGNNEVGDDDDVDKGDSDGGGDNDDNDDDADDTCRQGLKSIIICPVWPREQFPWRTIRKKVPYEGRTRRSDKADLTRTALLEIRTSPVKTMRNNFVAKNVSLDMSESEHSDSEFYYPGELSDAAMLQ